MLATRLHESKDRVSASCRDKQTPAMRRVYRYLKIAVALPNKSAQDVAARVAWLRFLLQPDQQVRFDPQSAGHSQSAARTVSIYGAQISLKCSSPL